MQNEHRPRGSVGARRAAGSGHGSASSCCEISSLSTHLLWYFDCKCRRTGDGAAGHAHAVHYLDTSVLPCLAVRACLPTFRPCGLCTPRHHRGLGRREYYAWARSPEWSQLAAAPAAARCRDAAARLRRGQRHRPSVLAAPPPPKQAPPSAATTGARARSCVRGADVRRIVACCSRSPAWRARP